jgi:hypothetical protein
MDKGRKKVADMREQIELGTYRVEPQAVADALLRQLRELAAARSEHVAPDERAWARAHDVQAECSNPEMGPLAPRNTTPAPPATTRPTTVKPTVIERLANVVSTTLSPDGGRQTQSS